MSLLDGIRLFDGGGIARIQRSLQRAAFRQGQRTERGLSDRVELSATSRGLAQASLSLNQGFGFTQTAFEAVNRLQKINEQMRQLVLESQAGGSTEKLASINARLEDLQQQFTQIQSNTSFNGIQVFNGLFSNLNVRIRTGQNASMELGRLSFDRSLNIQQFGTQEPQRTATPAGSFTSTNAPAFGSVQTPFPSSTRTNSAVIVADIDGDSHSDIIAGMQLNNYVSVLLGRGDGSFMEEVTLEVGNAVVDVELVDIDGDGDQDLLALAEASSQISIFSNDGLGSFNFESSFSVASDTVGFEVADFDGDDNIDIFTLRSRNSSRLSRYQGDGNFNFSFQASFTTGRDFTYLRSGDLDNDGDIDLILSSATESLIESYTNDGAGALSLAGSYSLSGTEGDILLVDYNNDNSLDLVSLLDTGAGYDLALFTGDGDGTFSFDQTLEGAASGTAQAIQAGDLDGDGDIDLIVNDDTGISLKTFTQDAGSFTGIRSNLGRFTDLILARLDDGPSLDVLGYDQLSAASFLAKGDISISSEVRNSFDYDASALLKNLDQVAAEIEKTKANIVSLHSQLEFAYGRNVGTISGGLGLISEFVEMERGTLSVSDILDLAQLTAGELSQLGNQAGAVFNFQDQMALRRILNLLREI